MLHQQLHIYLSIEKIPHNYISDHSVAGSTREDKAEHVPSLGGCAVPQLGCRQWSGSTLKPTKVNAQIIRTHLKVQIQD